MFSKTVFKAKKLYSWDQGKGQGKEVPYSRPTLRTSKIMLTGAKKISSNHWMSLSQRLITIKIFSVRYV